MQGVSGIIQLLSLSHRNRFLNTSLRSYSEGAIYLQKEAVMKPAHKRELLVAFVILGLSLALIRPARILP